MALVLVDCFRRQFRLLEQFPHVPRVGTTSATQLLLFVDFVLGKWWHTDIADALSGSVPWRFDVGNAFSF